MKLCECGCGEPAPLASRTDRRLGNVKGQPQRYVFGHSSRMRGLGPENPSWKGGRHVLAHGYVMIYAPESAHADKRGYVLEHVRMAELALGKPLPEGAEVHHFDENRSNNVRGNLVLCQDRAYHQHLHARQRALAACGNPSAKRCHLCHGYDRQEDIKITSQGKPRHRSCDREYQRKAS